MLEDGRCEQVDATVNDLTDERTGLLHVVLDLEVREEMRAPGYRPCTWHHTRCNTLQTCRQRSSCCPHCAEPPKALQYLLRVLLCHDTAIIQRLRPVGLRSEDMLAMVK